MSQCSNNNHVIHWAYTHCRNILVITNNGSIFIYSMTLNIWIIFDVHWYYIYIYTHNHISNKFKQQNTCVYIYIYVCIYIYIYWSYILYRMCRHSFTFHLGPQLSNQPCKAGAMDPNIEKRELAERTPGGTARAGWEFPMIFQSETPSLFGCRYRI